MRTWYVKPDDRCKSCHGRGEVANVVPWGSTTATEWLLCDCVTEQLPEEADWKDPVELVWDEDKVSPELIQQT